MKCILITTVHSGTDDIWGLAQTQNQLWAADGNKLSCRVGDEEVIIFKQIDELPDGEGDLTIECVREAKKTIERLALQKAEIFVFAHGATEHQLAQWAKTKKIKAVITSFSHYDADEMFQVLKKLAQDPTTENFELARARFEKKKTINFAAYFQHRFNRVVTPILVDFQGLEESAFNEDYWAEIVEDYQPNAGDPFIDFRNLADEMDKKNPPVSSGENSAEGDLLDSLNQYSEKAKILRCLSRGKGEACATDEKCTLRPYKCVSLEYSKKEPVGRVEELFRWAKDFQQKADKIIREQSVGKKDS